MDSVATVLPNTFEAIKAQLPLHYEQLLLVHIHTQKQNIFLCVVLQGVPIYVTVREGLQQFIRSFYREQLIAVSSLSNTTITQRFSPRRRRRCILLDVLVRKSEGSSAPISNSVLCQELWPRRPCGGSVHVGGQ